MHSIAIPQRPGLADIVETAAEKLRGFIKLLATVFTAVGESMIADYLDGTTAVPTNWYVAWGTGAGTAAKGDTTLFTESTEARVITTNTQPAADTNRFVGTITADGTKTITNAGIFDAATVGNLLIKGDHAGIAVDAGDKIEYTIDIQWS